MKQLLTAMLLVAFTLTGNAQNHKFGKVSKEELEQKQHAIDSTASAAVLYKNENIYFEFADEKGFMQRREVHERIKIYDKEGFDYATEKIFLYRGNGGSIERLSGLKGYTYNLIDGKIQKDKLKKDGIFEEDANEFIEINTITMPNVKEGCIIEFVYNVTSPFLGIDDIVFQYSIPIDKLDLRIASPEYYVYNKKVNPRAFYYPDIKSSTENKSATYKKTVQNNQASRSVKNYSSGSFEYKVNVLTANETDIPSLKGEAYAGNMDNYRAKMSLELSAILNSYGAVEKSFSSNWENVSKSIYDGSDFGNQLNKSNFFKDDIATLMASATDDFQKGFILQSYIKSKVKWNGLYGFRTHKGTRKAYKEGEGNVADINLLLIAMLRSQGVNASPVLVSTKDHGVPLFPTRKGFNYVICMIESQDSYALFDATEMYSMPNVLPQRVLNWQGRVIKDDGTSRWVSLRPTGKAKGSTALNVKINDDFSVNGKVRRNITDHLAMSYRKRNTGISDDEHRKRLEKNNGDIEVTEIEYQNGTNITEPVKLSYNYALKDGIDEIGDNLYFAPMLFMATKECPFKLEERQYPIDFIFPFEDKYMINIMIPEGYQVESLPESGIFEFKDGESKFTYRVKENGNFLQFNIALEINTSFINSADYKVFKEFFEMIVEKQSEQVVLKKV
ncbi:hypothetical protein [uncultured Psychroserpens sp.]|uniref:hypothetical protein n=1 Tax=uncultured Psychroserpens sp. TaxID=255436 RepID=UPI002612BDD9|nr:hypothetical protein [uncultured Psychroserpens sp.]